MCGAWMARQLCVRVCVCARVRENACSRIPSSLPVATLLHAGRGRQHDGTGETERVATPDRVRGWAGADGSEGALLLSVRSLLVSGSMPERSLGLRSYAPGRSAPLERVSVESVPRGLVVQVTRGAQVPMRRKPLAQTFVCTHESCTETREVVCGARARAEGCHDDPQFPAPPWFHLAPQ